MTDQLMTLDAPTPQGIGHIFDEDTTAEFVEYCRSEIPAGSIRQIDGFDYVNDHDVKSWLDEALAILGYPVGGWRQSIVRGPEITSKGEYTGPDGQARYYVKTACVVRLEIPVLGWWCEDQGCGDSVTRQAHTVDPGEAGKKAVTDGFKRCARNLADRFGGQLYKKEDNATPDRDQGGASAAPSAPAIPRPAPAGDKAEASTMVVTFGKNKGQTLGDLDDGYLSWIVEKGSETGDGWKPYPELVDAARIMLGHTAPAGDTPPPLPDAPPPGDADNQTDDDLPF